MSFEWDEQKARANLEKHGISFEEAATVFGDSLYVDFYDPDHSSEEQRYIILGAYSRSPIDGVVYAKRRSGSPNQFERSNVSRTESL